MTQGTNTDDKGTEVPKTGDDPETKTYSKDEIQAMLNELAGKVREEERAKAKKAADEKAKKDAEAARIAALEGEERLKEEHRIALEEVQRQRDEALHVVAVSNAKAVLSAKGYGDVADAIAPNLLGADEETTAKNIAAFDAVIQKMIADKVGQNLHRGTPQQSASTTAEPDWKKEMRDSAKLKK